MTFSSETSRAWVDVDLAALVANARTVAAVSGSRLLPMVKANGYGLGAVEVARALESVDPWGFGVASVDEGAALRAGGITRPLLVVTPLLPPVDRPIISSSTCVPPSETPRARLPGPPAPRGHFTSKSIPE